VATQVKKSDSGSRATTVETFDVQDAPTAEDAQRIGTLSSVLGGSGEIVVGAPEDVVPDALKGDLNTVTIRVNETIEDMSIVAGGRRFSARFDTDRYYKVPVDVAIELERIGKVFH